jgi:hypothetical protein
MIKFLIGVLVGAYFSAEILTFLNATKIPQEIKQQFQEYQTEKENK